MRAWKTVIGGIIGGSLMGLAACQPPPEEVAPEPQLSPRQQCYEACTKTVDASRSACRDELLEQGALDQLMDCNIAADQELATCRASCDEQS